MSDNPIDALAAALKADPKDALAIQALADYLEERGADPTALRALTVDGPTVLVLGFDHTSQIKPLSEMGKQICEFFQKHTGQPVFWVAAPNGITIRQIRAGGAVGEMKGE